MKNMNLNDLAQVAKNQPVDLDLARKTKQPKPPPVDPLIAELKAQIKQLSEALARAQGASVTAPVVNVAPPAVAVAAPVVKVTTPQAVRRTGTITPVRSRNDFADYYKIDITTEFTS